MVKSQNIESLRKRSEKICVKCVLLNDYKFYGNQGRRYYTEPQQYEHSQFSKIQNNLYKTAMYGLGNYKKHQLKKLPKAEKNKITQLQMRTQKELNIWKQQLVIKSSNKLLALFPNSPIAQEIIKDCFTHPDEPNDFSFRDLGIRKEYVIDRLHKTGILPEHFYEL